MSRPIFAAALLAVTALGAPATLAADTSPIGALRFIGAATIANDKMVDGTLVGGLSGLDFDAAAGTFVAISDDRSDNAPARFYTVKLTFSGDRLFTAEATKATPFLQANGEVYPNGKAGGEVPDPEAIRLDPADGNIWWTSEGDRNRGLNPFVRKVDRSGRQLADMPVPGMFAVHSDKESGTRNNLAFEGLTFAPDGGSFWVAMEGAIYEDGPIASTGGGAVNRFTRYDRSGKVIAQVAYPLDAIPAQPGAGKLADNGVSEVMALDDHRLLVIERSGVQGDNGVFRDYIRLYEADLAGASDVFAVPSLTGATYKPVAKRLLLNLDKADIGYVDNIEGASWGPKLSDGNRSLVLVSDNNFNKDEVTQFLAFEVLP